MFNVFKTWSHRPRLKIAFDIFITCFSHPPTGTSTVIFTTITPYSATKSNLIMRSPFLFTASQLSASISKLS